MRQARLLPNSGQFNHVLCLNERWIFRFPKSPDAAAELAHELEILPGLAGRLPLPIPNPIYSALESDRPLVMGYAMLPGVPLLRETYQSLRHDESIVERLLRHYPALRASLPRARLYTRNYALIQALYAIRDDDPASFADGMAAYV